MLIMKDTERQLNEMKQKRVGVGYGLAAFLSWGVLPLYFKAVAAVPSFQLLLAVAIFGEPFTRDHAVSFGLIWVALALYTVDTVRGMRHSRPNAGPQ